MNKKVIKTVVMIVGIIIFIAFIIFIGIISNSKASENNTMTSLKDYNEEDFSYDDTNATHLILNGESIETDNSKVSIKGNTATITNEGIYVLSGTLNGNINVDTQDTVRIILNNVNITSSDGPAIYVKNSDKTIITLVENTENSLNDTTTYSDAEASATLYSKDDIVFNGLGSLSVNGNYQDGIVGNDDLKIISGTYNVIAMNNGIKGKDSLKILDGNITINAQNDGIKSTNTEEKDKGVVEISNGTLNIASEHDAIQSSNIVNITGGKITIISGGGNENSTKVSQESDMFFRGQWRNPQELDNTQEDTDTESYKGIKAENSINISNANINVDSADDSIHSNGDIVLKSSTIEITSGDDGIHADNSIDTTSSNIDINKSYEGIEATKVTINDGEINIVASDDGINIAGGNDSSSIMGRPGQNTFSGSTDTNLTINSGKIYVDAKGDGLDSNGYIYVNGGEIYVDGPTDGANGALDYQNEFIMNGGTLIATGSSQMAQAISQSSKINCLSINTSATSSGEILITNSKGEEIISYTPSKNYQSIVIATKSLINGETYNININGDDYTSATISSVITNIGNGFGMQNMHDMRRF